MPQPLKWYDDNADNPAVDQSSRRGSAVRVSCSWEGAGFPRYVWYLEGDVLCEARLTNRENGEYHGYP
jgi:hypothetical protein